MLFLKKHKLDQIRPEDALPGRSEQMPVPERHEVLGTPLSPPFPEGLEQAVFGMGCFWGAERKFWQAPGVYTTAVGYAGGFTPNPTYKEVCSGLTGHTEAVLVVFDPAQTSYDELLRVFWENHDPTQGMRQGNDVGTQYRSAIYTYSDAQREAAEALEGPLPGGADRGGPRADHDRDRRGGPLLLRRGLPPAVSRQGAERLLRPRRHRRLLPGRRREGFSGVCGVVLPSFEPGAVPPFGGSRSYGRLLVRSGERPGEARHRSRAVRAHPGAGPCRTSRVGGFAARSDREPHGAHAFLTPAR